MGAFDSIKMGYRCRAWSLQSEVPPSRSSAISRGPKYQDTQWIVNAMTSSRLKEVTRESAAVLDGGPRWVLSTALGFFSGALGGTVILAVIFALCTYTVYVHTDGASSALTSSDEAAGVVAYTILAAVLSMASVPGVWHVADVFDWNGFAGGLVVELGLCVAVVVSGGVAHRFCEPFLENNAGLSIYADAARWIAPALVWVTASKLRQEATRAVETKLGGLWCCHPMADTTYLPIEQLWDDWSRHVEECASRVGGYSMLGFKESDLAVLRVISRSEKALQVIYKLGRNKGMDRDPTEFWIVQSLAFLAGYQCRLGHKDLESGRSTIHLRDVNKVIRNLLSQHHTEIDAFRMEVENDPYKKETYRAAIGEENQIFFYAGALIAESDHREEDIGPGDYGSRLAVSLAMFVEGTDPLARLHCFAEYKVEDSSVQLLSKAISSSTKALVSGLARSANVVIVDNPLGERGLAYAKGSAGSIRLEYSPDEMAAASHIDEAIVISEATFTAGTPIEIFEMMWRGSDNVEKRVDVSDMVPSRASGSEAGASACRGWVLHVGFTLAILTAYLFDEGTTAVVVLLLSVIPVSDNEVSVHVQNHFYMIYISFILNYLRFVSRGYSLSPRGQASVDKAQRAKYVVFMFVNVLPALACSICSGWKWWVACMPCILANLPGLLHTVSYGWKLAFEYEWWSWHMLNRWYSGRTYLQIVDLRRRVGRNVLSVNEYDTSDPKVVQQVSPMGGGGVRFMVIGG